MDKNRSRPESFERWQTERRGSGNPNWKGGCRLKEDNRISIRHLAEYKDFVASVLERAGHKCEYCGSTNSIVVHHKTSEDQAPELLMSYNNCVALCHSCHSKEHYKQGDIKMPPTRGEENSSAKLRESDILEIRRSHAAGLYSQLELSIKYGISRRQISSVLTRRAWKHI